MRKSSGKDEKVWVVGVLARGETVRFMKEIKGCGGASRAGTYLIFVTGPRARPVEKKSVMWRNFKFLYMTDVEKSKIHPHVD